MVAPEGGIEHGDDLRHRAHPRRRPASKVDQCGGKCGIEPNPADGEGRRQGEYDMFGLEGACAGLHPQPVGSGAHRQDRTVGGQATGREPLGEAVREILSSEREAACRYVDRIAVEPSGALSILIDGIPGEMLVVDRQAQFVDEAQDATLVRPEPGRTEIDGPGRTGHGVQASPGPLARLEQQHVDMGRGQQVGNPEA